MEAAGSSMSFDFADAGWEEAATEEAALLSASITDEQLQSLAGTLSRKQMRQQGQRFLAATADCRSTQQRLLRELMELNGSSLIGREYGLERVSDPAEFRRAIGVTDYEFYRPWIEQLKAGNQSAML